MKLIDLTIPLGIATPAWPTYEPLQVKYFKRLAPNGANGQVVTHSNHVGTHLDGEIHFYSPGKDIASLDMDFLYETGCPKLHMKGVWKKPEVPAPEKARGGWILGAGAISIFLNDSVRCDTIVKTGTAPWGRAIYFPPPGRFGAPSSFGSQKPVSSILFKLRPLISAGVIVNDAIE